MASRTRRRLVLGVGLVAAPALAASIAYACVSLATLSVSNGTGTVGQTVSGTGTGFSGMMGTVGTNVSATPSPVEIHFGSRSGDVVWTGLPNGTGQISFAFNLPQVAPGQHVIFATQTSATGTAVGGTPARGLVEVVAAPAPVETPAPAAVETAAPQPSAAVTPAPARVARAAAPAPAVVTPTPAPVVTPAPAVEATPAPAPAVVTPAPAVAVPAPVAVAPAPARRSVMVSMSGGSDGSPWLAIGLVGMGLVLSLGATALVIAGRRERKAPVAARR